MSKSNNKVGVKTHQPTAKDTFEALKKTDYRSLYQRIDDISICTTDWPDFHVEWCFLDDGTELDDKQLDEIEREHYDDLYEDAVDQYMGSINWRKKF